MIIFFMAQALSKVYHISKLLKSNHYENNN